jgi:hypothetical protein
LSILTDRPPPAPRRLKVWPILPILSAAPGALFGYDAGAHGGSLETVFLSFMFVLIVGAIAVVAGIASFFTVRARLVAMVALLCLISFCGVFWLVNQAARHF